jgi:hypothetical protein
MSGIEGGCDEVAVASSMFPEVSRFCQRHQEELEGIRAELESKAWENNVRNKEGAIGPYCETAGCEHRPMTGRSYCAVCTGGDV